MGQESILAIDQGTTNTKAVLLSLDGQILQTGSMPTHVCYPQPGWAEQSADDIRSSVAHAIAQAIHGHEPKDILAISISNQRETAVAWHSVSSEPVGPAILWQCRRSMELCSQLRKEGYETLIRERTGLGLDPLFTAGKLHWLLGHQASAHNALRSGKLRVGTVDSWLLWNLSGGAIHATDTSNASRSQLMSLGEVAWDAELLNIFGIPPEILPQIQSSDALFGYTAGGFAGLPDGIPIHSVLGDSHASLFGHQAGQPGCVKVTLGTGSSIMYPTGTRKISTHGLSDTVAWSTAKEVTYALEGNISVSGHAAAFASQVLGLRGPQELTNLALTVSDNGGVSFVPALAGLGAPHWQADARGIYCGLSLATTPAHMARAALEGIAHQICDVIAAMEADLGRSLDAVSVDGGAASNALLLHMLADYSGCSILRPSQTELSALGGALMAAYGMGRSVAPDLMAIEETFHPQITTDRRAEHRHHWAESVARTLSAS